MKRIFFFFIILLNSLVFAVQLELTAEINNVHSRLQNVNSAEENWKMQIQQIFESSTFDYFSTETIERYTAMLSADLNTEQINEVLFEMSTYDLALRRDWGDLLHVSIPITKTMNVPLTLNEQTVINDVIGDLRYDEQTLENSHLSPSVAVDANGNFAIVWKESANVQELLFIQRYDKNGNENGAAVQVIAQEIDQIQLPSAAINSTGQILVAWYEKQNDQYALKARVLNADGEFTEQETLLISSIHSSQKIFTPTIKITPDDNFAILWYLSKNDNFDLIAQHVSTAGQLLGENYTAGKDVHPSTSFICSGDKTFTAWRQNQVSVDNKTFSTSQLAGINLTYNQIDDSGFPNIVSYVTVQDANGDPIQGMYSSQFSVSENGRNCSPIQVSAVGTSSSGADFVLVIDRSGSMAGQPLQDAKDAATIFVNQLTSNDRAAIISYSNYVTIEQSLTNNKNLLINAINGISYYNMTSHYDAVMEAIDLIDGSNRRKAIISLTDGVDNYSSADVYDCINQANVESIPIFTIGLYNSNINRIELNRLADDTGGHYYEPASRQDLLDIYQSIAILIHSQYRITYTSPNTLEDCTERSVRITANYYGSSDSGTKSYMAPCGPVYQPNFYIKVGGDFPSVCPTEALDHEVIICNKIGPAHQDVTVCAYLSTDRNISKSDYKLGCTTATPNDFGHRNYCTVIIHCDPSRLEAGTYYFGLIIDPYNQIDESNEDDNSYCASTSTQVPQKDYVKVTSPNGGESWECGKQYSIQWDRYGSGNVRIELLKGTSVYTTITSSTSNDGSYTWSIPSSYDASSNCRIRIASISNSNVSDTSDDYFSIKKSYTMTVTTPNGGENWQLGSTHTIYWSSNAGGYVKINLLRDGSYYKTITSSTSNDGSYTWSISSQYLESSYYKINITSTSDASLTDESNSYFQLSAPTTMTVVSPNGSENWQLGSSHAITWDSNAGGNVKIELYKQNSFYKTIASSTSNDGTLNWVIPNSYDEYAYYRIRITSTSNSSIYDYSNNYFQLSAPKSLTVTTPNGGEKWNIGSTHSINWTSNAGGYVKIHLFKQGSFYKELASSTVNDGSFSWAIPADCDEYSSYRIRITSTSNSSIYDYSDGYFEISAPKSLIVISPNGGEQWEIGSTKSITWSSNAGGYVKIQLFKQSVLYTEISSSTNNDGSYSWIIPSDCSESEFYRVIITSTVDNSIFDYSENYFSIIKPAAADKHVWPGDTNNNGYVDQADVLPIGMYFGSIGPNRATRGNQWNACVLADWTNEAAGYADCDGSGKVDQADILAIGLNWHKSHAALAKSNTCLIDNKSLYLQLHSGIDKTGQFIDVSADNANDLIGISFELDLNLDDAQIGSIRYLDAFTSDIIHYENIHTDQAAIGVVSVKENAKSNGSLKICRVYYQGQSNGDDIQLCNIVGMTAHGELLTAMNDVYTLAANQIASPSLLTLYPNYPNPFNPITTIRYDVPEDSEVRLDIMNVKGEVVKILVQQQQTAGSYAVQWDGQDENSKNVSSGIYLCRVCSGSSIQTIKMILAH